MRPLARETAATSPSSAFPSALRAGALAALGTWTVVVLPALVGWVAAPDKELVQVMRERFGHRDGYVGNHYGLGD